MDDFLQIGHGLKSENGIQYKVIEKLGAGGQGEVYLVSNYTKQYALKWYYPKTATGSQEKIIRNLINKGKPDQSFLWPQDFIKEQNSFGYVMELRPSRYKGIVDLMKGRTNPTFYTLCKIAFNTTKGFKKLHENGYSYCDISFGNLFFDPETGDILICDNDNVNYNGADNISVYGTPRFMAPEIVRGEASPSRLTDQYSLAVLLFLLFMVHHPLDGRIEANIKCMDIAAMNKLYGTDPIFIFDPDNKANRPIPGIQDNPLIYWEIYPDELKQLFIKAFTVGLKSPNRRVTENEWLDVFANMMCSILECPKCGAGNFYDSVKESWMTNHTCWGCNSNLQLPHKIVIGNKNLVLLNKGASLYAHHINRDYDMETKVAEVVQNPKNPAVLGIKNMSKKPWTYIKADGTHIPVDVGRSAAIISGTKINFGANVGEVY